MKPSSTLTSAKPSRTNGKSILVVDDEVGVCTALGELLAGDGYSVSTVTSGDSALELCKTRTFDLIFLDFYLPDTTGDRVVALVKWNYPGQAIVLMSGERPCPPLGKADWFISKPFSPTAIREAVAKFASPAETSCQ